jgi:uncharacterized protein
MFGSGRADPPVEGGLPVLATRLKLAGFGVALTLAVFAYVGPRSAMLIALGLSIGLVMEGLRLGFAGPWRLVVVERDARGMLAQLLAIGLTAVVAIPLLVAHPNELVGAHGPVGFGMVLGAFLFGAAMQIAMGCGSGTLLNAGSGNLVGGVALVFFIAGSFIGTLHLGWWANLGSLPVVAFQDGLGAGGAVALTLAGLAAVGAVALRRAAPGKRMPPGRLWIAAALLAGLAVLNLMIAGQPWGIVYGLGLWGAKIAQAGGMDVAATAFWSSPGNAERLRESILLDATSLTNIGLVTGAFIVMRWKAAIAPQTQALRATGWIAVAFAGLVLGYSSRMAFGCNVGAYFSGISTGSLHGWVWLVAGFAGSMTGIRLRGFVLVPAAPSAVARPA